MSWLGRVFGASERRERVPLSDSITCHYTVSVLVALALLTAFPQLIMDEPITCDVSNNTSHIANYVNNICWSRGSILSNVKANLSADLGAESPANRRMFTRLPLVFLLEGFLLYLPHLLWLIARQNPVVPFQTLLHTAVDWYETDDLELSDSRLKFLSSRLHRFLVSIKAPHRPRKLFTLYGNYLTVCYLSMKVMYIILVSTCLSFTAVVMNNMQFELSSLIELSQGEYTSDYLPPTVLCEYTDVARDFLLHVFTCTLPQNELNQMIFLALGSWFTLLLCINIIALIQLIVGTVLLRWRAYDIRMYLECGRSEEVNQRQLEAFLHKFLRRDGVFILQFIGFLTSDQLVALVVEQLWEICCQGQNANTENDFALTNLT